MAHPNLVALAPLPQAVGEAAVFGDLDGGAAELLVIRALDLAAELGAEGLLAVADAEDRHPEIEHPLRAARCLRLIHRGGPAGENHRAWREGVDASWVHVEGEDLAVNAGLAHPPGDQLGHLGPEVQNQDSVRHERASPSDSPSDSPPDSPFREIASQDSRSGQA